MQNPTVQLYPYLFQPSSGAPIAAEWGKLNVPENRLTDESRFISIPFVRFPCSSKNPGQPIVFLQGGPGGSPLSNLDWLWTRSMIRPSLEMADFIFIEHRGFGLTRPSLDCPGTYNIALDIPGTPDLYIEAHRQYLTNSVSFWREQGVDIGSYNVKEMAADINDLRQALGYERISLLGGSFGSHHGLAMLRYYSQYIDRALLWSVEGPNHTLKLPSNIQKHLAKLNSLLKKDLALNAHIPDLLDLMAIVLDRLERKPVTVETFHPQTNEAVNIALGKFDLQLVTANGMGKTPYLRVLPIRFLSLAEGDYSWLAEQVIRARVNLKSNLMYEATDCASGATPERKEQIAAESPNTLLGDAINEPFHQLSDVLGYPDLGDDFRGRLVSDVPTMLVGGSLDVRTPVSNAEELLPDLSNGELLTIDGVSHDLAIRGDHIEELTEFRDRFFRGEPLMSNQLHASFAFRKYEDYIQQAD